MVGERWGVEIFAAMPVKHEVTSRDIGKIAEFKQLPPAISLQYSPADRSEHCSRHIAATRYHLGAVTRLIRFSSGLAKL
jgi:hypothetical protein